MNKIDIFFKLIFHVTGRKTQVWSKSCFFSLFFRLQSHQCLAWIPIHQTLITINLCCVFLWHLYNLLVSHDTHFIFLNRKYSSALKLKIFFLLFCKSQRLKMTDKYCIQFMRCYVQNKSYKPYYFFPFSESPSCLLMLVLNKPTGPLVLFQVPVKVIHLSCCYSRPANARDSQYLLHLL